MTEIFILFLIIPLEDGSNTFYETRGGGGRRWKKCEKPLRTNPLSSTGTEAVGDKLLRKQKKEKAFSSINIFISLSRGVFGSFVSTLEL
jgi:hypothetical protein